MLRSRRLRVHHELLLLALHDEKGTLAFGQMQHVGLAGAVFAELLLAERLAIVEETRRRRTKAFVEVADASRVGEGVMDAALANLAGAKRRASPKDTVGRIARIKGLRHDVGRELARKGVLRATEDQVLLVFKRRVYPTVDPGPERELVARVREALEGDGTPDDHTILLVALAHATSTLRAIYGRKELKALKPRVEELSARAGEGAEAAGAAIRAAQAAAVAATTAAVTAAAASSAG